MMHLFVNDSSTPMKWSTLAALAAVFYLPLTATAISNEEGPESGLIKTDRYTMTRLAPRSDQVNPMDAIVNISFSSSVASIGDALDEILDGTGYRLVHIKSKYGEPVDNILMSQPLPGTQRQIGPVTLRDALNALGGSAWALQHNELGREVWFDVKTDYEDDSRIRRLLAAVKQEYASSAPATPAVDISRRYVAFPPGKSTAKDIELAGQQRLDDVANLVKQHPESITRVVVRGESQSTGKHATSALAKKRAGEVANALIKRGIPADKIDERYSYKNHAEENRQGAYIEFEASPQFTARNTSSNQPKTTTASVSDLNDTAVVQAENIFFLYPGEDLEVALRRWTKQALYHDLVWNVRDESGSFVRIPIRAAATFQCEFAECLRRVKEAYATAPRPLYFDIALKERNKIVYVELLHYGE